MILEVWAQQKSYRLERLERSWTDTLGVIKLCEGWRHFGVKKTVWADSGSMIELLGRAQDVATMMVVVEQIGLICNKNQLSVISGRPVGGLDLLCSSKNAVNRGYTDHVQNFDALFRFEQKN